MEWFGLALVGAVVFFWWLGREPSQPERSVGRPESEQQPKIAGAAGQAAAAGMGVGLMGAEVLRRATDMNDPDGTFMDGYVAGRLTERAEGQDELDVLAARQVHDDFDTSHRWSGAEDEAWEEWAGPSDHAADDDMSDD